MIKRAEISYCQRYRYSLTRDWGMKGLANKKLIWVMLNPSTADANTDDHTIRKCVGFSVRYGYHSLEVVNLFAYRATSPKDLKAATNPEGPDNDFYLERAAGSDHDVIIAWGNHGTYMNRDNEAMKLFPHANCLGVTKGGNPKHNYWNSFGLSIGPDN